MQYIPVVQALLFTCVDLCILYLVVKSKTESNIKIIFGHAALFVTIVQIIAIFDMLQIYTEVSYSITGLYVLYISMMIANVMVTLFWYFYLIINIKQTDAYFLLRRLLLFTPIIVTVIFSVTAPFNHLLFYVDEEGFYQRGRLFVLQLICPYTYVLAGVIASIHYRKEWGIASRVLKKLILLIIPCTLCVFLQIGLDLDGGYSQIGFSIALVFSYIGLYEDQVKTARELKNKENIQQKMLDSTMRALAYSIDAKDTYTQGHSERVAEYSLKLAKNMRLSEEQCREIVQAALLHDIGKLGVSEDIINKKEFLIDEEVEDIKTHTERGDLILSQFEDVPYLRIGARYHHERYDGKGYPDGLKGEEIPLYARIIAVADAYDAMSSNRSYRNTMNQADVKQEIWKGRGTQFDPYIGKQMISLIDADVNYDMREKPGEKSFFLEEIRDKDFWNRENPVEITEEERLNQERHFEYFGVFTQKADNWMNPTGLLKIGEQPASVHFVSHTNPASKYIWHVPTIILYTSDDGTIAPEKHYKELSVIIGAGYYWKAGDTVRTVSDFQRTEAFTDWDDWMQKNKEGLEYTARVYREKNFVYLSINNELLNVKARVELPANYQQNIFMAVTGENCRVEQIKIG